MADVQHQHRITASSRLGIRNRGAVAGGEIVEVQGGHIVRSTGRKDRHSKVCTAKGPRDRRVRLAAHTAIQFYDVQDRLGYDRPSKAVDWLIKKAKAAIDELAELPPWSPTTGSTMFAELKQQEQHREITQTQQQLQMLDTVTAGPSDKNVILRENRRCLQQQMTSNENSNQSFLPTSLDSNTIDDSIKTFFPMGTSGDSNSSAVQFHQSFPTPELLSRSSSQDLRLSLHSFQQGPMLLQNHNPQAQHHNSTGHAVQVHSHTHALFSGASPLGFDVGSWAESQRSSAWSVGGDTAGGGGSGGGSGAFMFNLPTTPPLLQPLFGQHQMFSQRGPLQSSNTPSIRAWMDPTLAAITMATTADHHQHLQTIPVHPSSSSMFGGLGFASGFSGFQIPARIQGQEEEQDGISDKPSSVSSDSRR